MVRYTVHFPLIVLFNEVDRPLNMKCSFSSFSLGIKPLEFRSLCAIRCRSTRGWWIQYYSSAITVWRSRYSSKQRWYNLIMNDNEWTPTDKEWDQLFGSTYILIIFCLLIWNRCYLNTSTKYLHCHYLMWHERQICMICLFFIWFRQPNKTHCRTQRSLTRFYDQIYLLWSDNGLNITWNVTIWQELQYLFEFSYLVGNQF